MGKTRDLGRVLLGMSLVLLLFCACGKSKDSAAREGKKATDAKGAGVFGPREINIVSRIDKPFRIKRVQDKDRRVSVEVPKNSSKELIPDN